MSPELAAGLRAVAEALPAGTPVPVPREVLLELLEASGRRVQTSAMAGDLTVADLCAAFGRKPSAVRAWLERGDFPGAYKLHGRDWRVPAAAVEAFRLRQSNGDLGQGERAGEADPGAWRDVVRQRGAS